MDSMAGRVNIYALALWCLLGAVVPVQDLAASAIECPAYLWISFGEQCRLKDGSVRQRYHIRNSGEALPGTIPCSDLQVFYRLGDRSFRGQGYYSVPVLCTDGDCFLDITCATFARLELTVIGKCGGRQFMAQTVHSLFGKASSVQPSTGALINALPMDKPCLDLTPSRADYYMETGRTYHLRYSGATGEAGVLKTVLVHDDRKQFAQEIVMAPTGDFTYTPPHDPRLDNTGANTSKETILLVTENSTGRECATTFTLLLHRSRSAHLRRLSGVILFGLTGAATLVLVIVLKKRPWYR